MKNAVRQEILSGIQAIEKNRDLISERNFLSRTQALDDIEFLIIDRLHAIKESGDSSGWINKFIQHAEKVYRQLEAVNSKMFVRLRSEISLGKYRQDDLIQLIDEYLDHHLDEFLQQHTAGYDDLDIFINGILTYRELPPETIAREPDMVFYQKTPARIVFELVKKTDFQSHDVFYDLGSGLGQVTLLVHLLTSVDSKGVEREPVYCEYAKTCASELNLDAVDFLNADARQADYSDGTVFFLYSPCKGKILRDVLGNLYAKTGDRKIRIFSYGSCTQEIQKQDWLRPVHEIQNSVVELAEFERI